MPILDIEIVGDEPTVADPGLSRRLADAAGAALASRPAGTWVRLRFLPAGCYAENQVEVAPAPVFVSVIERTVPPAAELAVRVGALTRAVAEVCGRPAEQVHVIYGAAAAGRVAFGGQLVAES